VKPSSQVRSQAESVREEPRHLPRSCPGCGRRLDAATRRCPTCLLWLLPLPARPQRGRVVVVGTLGALLLGVGAFLGVALYLFFSNVPRDVVVHEAAGVVERPLR